MKDIQINAIDSKSNQSLKISIILIMTLFFYNPFEGYKINGQNSFSGIENTIKKTHYDPHRNEWGGMDVEVNYSNGKWIIKGKKQEVILDESDLSLSINTDSSDWSMFPSQENDMLVQRGNDIFEFQLISADSINIQRYDVGYKTGIKIVMSGWKDQDFRLFLTLCLEGEDEDLVFYVSAEEGESSLKQLNWPTALLPEGVDHTVLSNWRGVLLPSNWPKAYNPIRTSEKDESLISSDSSEIESNIIECWSMSWWGFQKAESAMMVIIETPDDAAYQFSHPIGGPTIIGPRWRESLGKFRYPRSGRFCFIENGNYVNMAKRYRKYAKDKGTFVSLKDKISSRPIVQSLIGTPLIRSNILRNYKEDGARWKLDTANRYKLTTFDQKSEVLRHLKESGIDKLHVVLTGWPNLGYDRQHPDVLPVSPIAGGYTGMKRLLETCNELGYLLSLHDQYRDFYVDAPSFNTEFAIHEENSEDAPMIFPGTRFGSYKEGRVPFMDYWDGGKMTYLNSRFMLGHLKKNYRRLFENNIFPVGSYLDVFGYVPPDQDFNSVHYTTRSESISARIDCYQWVKNNLGLVGTEAACDWTVPYVDYSSPLNIRDGIEIPLWELVYHDAIFTTFNPMDLRGTLYGGMPQINSSQEIDKKLLDNLNRMITLQKEVALLEMVNHEFLDDSYRRERTTFSNGTKVIVDWDSMNVSIEKK